MTSDCEKSSDDQKQNAEAKERRVHDRVSLKVQVKLNHPEFGEKIVYTRDISDTGLYILTDVSDMPPVGTVVEGQVIGMAAEPPTVELEIVRYEKDGIGVRFVVKD